MGIYPTRLNAIGLSGLVRLTFAFSVMVIEFICRILLMITPSRVLAMVDRIVEVFWPSSSDTKQRTHLSPGVEEYDMNVAELIELYGYSWEQRTCLTDDGFWLVMYRVFKDEKQLKQDRPTVLLHHGFMQCCEVFVTTQHGLAFQLVEQGYDVWLGNARGNKYSSKHARLKPTDTKFWDWSLDEMAMFDVPTMIDYILEHTGQKKLSYVAFSQGTAVGFACFSTRPEYAAKVKLFVALSPAAKANGLTIGLLKTFVHMAPQSFYLFFGTRALMPFINIWRSAISRQLFAKLLDGCMRVLFAWKLDQMGDMTRKSKLYAHLYSITSVKSVVHWFQIVACNRFQQFDEQMIFSTRYRSMIPASYEVSQVSCPMAVVYGSADELTDIPWLLKQLPSGTKTFCVDDYEHLDTIWAEDAKEKVFPLVIQMLKWAQTEAKSEPNSKHKT
eukprot:TRINITY_DN11347_c0_g1_i7.p1 TRINITY_DN11347_c0_g1~~TRINITY_DN11347_c0_g1_i7.p1  ORF type:complete len:443 (+),score=54.52 TRINITY_DN11347_c0_g1_i7:139-1467(+)